MVPRQTFVHNAIASAPIERVWRALQRPEIWAGIGGVSRVDSASYDDQGDLTGYRFNASVGGLSYAGTATRAAFISARSMVMDIDSEQLMGSINIILAAVGPQTAVTVELTMCSKGFAAALLFPVISGAVASGFNETVERFVTSLEE